MKIQQIIQEWCADLDNYEDDFSGESKYHIERYIPRIIEALGEELIGEDEKPLFSERYETAGHQDKSLRKRGRNELRSIQRLKLKEIINSLK